jgi:regulation of enolase protein 1 (concanavalin A-like superfamily)
MMFDVKKLDWIREPKSYIINDDEIVIITESYTDLWQRTYYHFRNDNAPVLQIAIA